jgi:signal transduction histidine kinase
MDEERKTESRSQTCWEKKACERPECPLYGEEEQACWGDESAGLAVGGGSIGERLKNYCLKCDFFRSQLSRTMGRRGADHELRSTFEVMLAQLSASEEELSKKIRELSILREVGRLLQGVYDQDRAFHIILTGVTSGQTLGLNRAFLLLMDEGGKLLEGKMGVGPANGDEAGEIWDRIASEGLTFEQLAMAEPTGNPKLKEFAQSLRIPVSPEVRVVYQAVHEKRAIWWTKDQGGCSLCDKLGVDEIAVAPLVSEDRVLGVLIADNVITRQPIRKENLVMMEILAEEVGAAVERTRLHEALEWEVRELEQAQCIIQESQASLLRAERLAAMGEMAATMAHEIRNPLVSIGGFARAMLAKKPEGDPDRDFLGIIVEETERLENLVQGALNYTLWPEPKLALRDVTKEIEEALMLMEEACEQSHIRVVTDMAPDLPAVELDSQQFRQVLLNLMQNAIQAMPEGGTLAVKAELRNGSPCISITDTGIGIPEGEIERIYQPFFTTKKGGAGLGLPVALRIVRSHGGDLKVESTEGRGTRVVITLPQAREA